MTLLLTLLLYHLIPYPIQPHQTQPMPKSIFNALSRTSTPEALHLYGFVHHSLVTVLINGNTTHKFIQSRVAKYLQLHTITTTLLQLTVGNGFILPCDQIFPHTPLLLQEHVFSVDLHVLPISGADIVLGIQWLKQLGPTITCYDTLTMQFRYDGAFVTLQVDAPTIPKDTSSLQLWRLIQTHSASTFSHISISPNPAPSSTTTLHHPILTITTLLHKYCHLFQTPNTLPPPRNITHQIHLLPNIEHVNIRPYRYPYFQKVEIEKQVTEMLSASVIQLSHSPFSSQMLLVKKRDGNWRFYVDYRALNVLMVKDHFPMSMIDELLDWLGTTSWFSKLDLKQGFH